MSKTEGPWSYSSVGYGDLWRVECEAKRHSGYFEGYVAASAKADELNKLEAVREAAPELLAACKRLINACEDEFDWAFEDLKAVVAKAEQA